jgi:hypothetical protein
MPANPADAIATLEKLVRRIIQESDPLKYDTLGSEIWAGLDKLERLRTHLSDQSVA